MTTTGSLKAQFNANGKIDMLEHGVQEHNEYIPRPKPRPSPESPEQKPSPSALKNNAKNRSRLTNNTNNKRLQVSQDSYTQPSIPPSCVNPFGVTNAVSHMLEVMSPRSLLPIMTDLGQLAETFFQMEHLFQFSHQNPHLSASEALGQLVASFGNLPHQNLNAAMQSFANQLPPGQRTPGLNGPHQFASPVPGPHLNLPINTTTGSPATINMSPAMHNHVLQNHLQQAPTSIGMVAQQSQQGTNTSVGTGSQGTSANTSPNVTNKRRRTSTAKMEIDDGGGGNGSDINGTGPKGSVQPSPRINSNANKRQKGN